MWLHFSSLWTDQGSGISAGAWSPPGFLYAASAQAAGALINLHVIEKVAQMKRCGTIAASVFPERTHRHAPAPWDPRVGTSKCKWRLSVGGTLSRLFIAGHLVKMCPLSLPPCSSLCFGLSLFADVGFYAGRTRERRL